MARRARSEKVAPVSVALAKPERSAFESEAERRGLGLSTTIRTLAFERVNDLREQRQRDRTLRWQSDRLHALLERIRSEGFREASQADIDAIFAEAEALDPRLSSPAT